MICEAIKTAKPDMSVIPAFASLSESVYYIIEANEKDFTEMIKSIGIHELGIFEATGSVLLYEENSEEKQENDTKKENFLVKVWARIKAFFEKVLTKIKEQSAKVAALFANNTIRKTNIEANIDKLPDDFKYERYQYTKLRDALKASNPEDLLRARSNTDDETTKKSIDKFTNSDSTTAAEIRKEIRGEKETLDKAGLKKNITNIINVVTTYENASSAVKNFYKNTQKYFDKLIADAKKAENSNKEALNEMKMNANRTVLYANILLSEYYSLYMENVNLVFKLAKVKDTKVEDKKEETKEEAKPEEKKEEKEEEAKAEKKEAKGKEKVEVQHNSAFDSELSSLFDWSY